MRAGLFLAAAAALAASPLLAPQEAFAPCPAVFFPPGFGVMPDHVTNALVVFSQEERAESLVLEPAFHGDAAEFGMVLPLPARPHLEEAEEGIFERLDEYTRTEWGIVAAPMAEGELALASDASSVRVVETKDVGDFTASVLTADSAGALLGWLGENGYGHAESDADNFEYYVGKGGYYFVALKVNMGGAEAGDGGEIDGKLRPIRMTFQSEEPMLPFRIMASDMEVMALNLYAISEYPYFIPGTDVTYMAEISGMAAARLSSGSDYTGVVADALDRARGAASEDDLDDLLSAVLALDDAWLVRTEMDFDPAEIRRNVVLSRADRLRVLDAGETRLVINPGQLPSEAGVVAGSAGRVIEVPPFAESVSPAEQQRAGIPAASVECAEGRQLVISPGGRGACFGPSLVALLDASGWEPSERRAAELERLR